MNNKVRVGVLASLLLAPATLANANEQAPIIQQNEQVPFNVVANVSERDIILAAFSLLNEESTSSDLELAEKAYNDLTPEQEALLGNDLALIRAKIDYVEAYGGVLQQLKDVKTAIDGLTLTSPTLIDNVPNVRADYTDVLEELATIQTEFKSVFNTTPTAEIKASLKYVDNTVPQNIVLAHKTITNYQVLETRESEIVGPVKFIEDEIPKLANLEKETYKTVIDEVKKSYDSLGTNGKKIVDAHPDAQKYKKALEVQKAVETVDRLYKAILDTKFTSVSTLASKMDELDAALTIVGAEYEILLQADIKVITELKKIRNLVEKIANLKIENYREVDSNGVKILDKLNSELEDINSLHATRVFNRDKLTGAIKDVAAADNVIDLIKNLDINNPTTLQKATESYNNLSTTQKKLVPTDIYDDLQSFQQNNKSAAAVMKMIDGLKPALDSTFLSRLNAARASYEKLSDEGQKHVTNIATLTQLEQFKPAIEKVVNLKLPSSIKAEVEKYEAAVTEARTAHTSTKSIDISSLSNELQTLLKGALDVANTKLQTAEGDISRAKNIVAAIEGLVSVDPAVLLAKLNDARKLYDDKLATSANAKKLVYNYSTLVALEKQYTAVLKVTRDIDVLPTYYNKTSLLSRLQSVKKAYDSLGDMKGYVYNQSALQQLEPVMKFMTDVNALKPKDTGYEAKVKELQNDYTALIAGLGDAQYDQLREMLNENYNKKLEIAYGNISDAEKVVKSIQDLKSLTADKVGAEITNIKEQYKKVKQKNLVTNYKEFQAIEKDYKKASKVIKMITDLPQATLADAKNYAKKVDAAQKAYNKLTEEQKKYVYNESSLKDLIQSAQVIGMIADLKTSSKDYLEKLEAAKQAYAKLSEEDKKKVVNASLLDNGDAMKASVEEVEALIRAAIPTATDYIQKLIEARQAYDGLSKDEQRMVSNIKDLTTREKAVKPVLKLTEDIAALDPANATKFISQYKSALKAHENLSFADRALVTNEQRLVTELAPIFKVMEQISLIKESSKTFVEDVTKARAAYNALSASQQAQISNYARLLEQELNVQGGARVDEMIRAIKGSNPKEYVANVKAAREAYNALSSANKKGVTLINDLKEEEKYIKPVEVVMQLIDGLSNPRNDMAKQVTSIQKALAKLNNEQQSFVANMSDYTDLASIIHVYELIQKLNPSDKYYIGNLQAAQTAYGKLSAEEKMRVTNYYKLQEAITNVEGVENVIKTIGGLSSSSSTYFEDVEKALDLYKALPSALKKQVHNYDILKNAEKSIKNAQKVINTIDQIDPTVRSFEAKVKSARKAYDKLSPEEKMLVTNYTFLTRYELELGL